MAANAARSTGRDAGSWRTETTQPLWLDPLARMVATMSSIMGEFVTETLEFDGGRKVTAYVPSGAPQAVVFAGDGQLISQWGGFLEGADLPPTLVVGVHRSDDETRRLHEYSPKF